MRKPLSSFVLCVATAGLLLTPEPSFAWGVAVHRYVMARAIDLLPSGIKPFFLHYRDELVIRSTDPDTWRTAGWDDDPNHFINFGVPEFGPYPFTALPREYGAALEKFGAETLKKQGTLPWRAAEEFGNLRRAFEGFTRHAPYAPLDAVLFSAVAGHYFQDATEPFHATINYDGQLTGQFGIHARFETVLFERFERRLHIDVAAGPPMTTPRDAAFDALLAGYKLADPILSADRAAIAGKDAYDDEYYDRFFAKVQPVLEQQIGAAITVTAALITGAWEQAGRPALVTTMPAGIQKVRKPKEQKH